LLLGSTTAKPASLKWECILDPVSPCRITLQNLSASLSRTPLPRKQQEAKNKGTIALL
jgi:hypothetical protein